MGRCIITSLVGIIDREKILGNYILREIGPASYLVPLHEQPDDLVALNRTAAFFWRAIQHNADFGVAASEICQVFHVSQSQARKNLNVFLGDLIKKNFKPQFNQSLDRDKGSVRVPFNGSFELTGRCNLRCFHCYAVSEKGKKELTTDQIKTTLNQLANSGCLFLQLTGGECTARKDFGEIYTYTRRLGIIPTVSTNATLIDQNLIDTFREYPPYYILISLYGSSPQIHDKVTGIKGSFGRTTKSATALHEAGIKVAFSVVVFRENLEQVEATRHLAMKMRVPATFYPQLIPTLDNKTTPLCHSVPEDKCDSITALNQPIPFLEKWKKPARKRSERLYPCSAGETSFHLDCSGNLFLCKMERTQGFSVTERSFEECWGEIRNIRNDRLRLPEECSACNKRLNCTLCPVMYRRFLKTGVINLYCSRMKGGENHDTGKGKTSKPARG